MASIFGTKENADDFQHEVVAKASKETISSILSKDMAIDGEITFKGKARIDGLVNGDVTGEHLVLSQSGKIIGDVTVESLVCHGTIQGNIEAKVLTAHPTAYIQGVLAASNLTVESGASLNGEIKALKNPKMGDPARSASSAKPGQDKQPSTPEKTAAPKNNVTEKDKKKNKSFFNNK